MLRVFVLIGLLTVAGCCSFSRKVPRAEDRQDQVDRDAWAQELEACGPHDFTAEDYQFLLRGQLALEQVRRATR